MQTSSLYYPQKAPLTEEGQELKRLLSFDNSPVVTPGTLVTALAWVIAKTKDIYQESNHTAKQKWFRPAELAKIFGTKRAQMNVWLKTLESQGKVRTFVPETPTGKPGFTYYLLQDIEAAWEQKKERVSHE